MKIDDKTLLSMPYQKSNRHPHMSLLNRAAQFAPFAALTGFDDSIEETGHLLVNKIKISSEKEQELNAILNSLYLDKSLQIKLTYFKLIKNKQGEYKNYIGKIIDIDPINKIIILNDKTTIKFENIYNLSIF